MLPLGKGEYGHQGLSGGIATFNTLVFLCVFKNGFSLKMSSVFLIVFIFTFIPFFPSSISIKTSDVRHADCFLTQTYGHGLYLS